MIQFLFDTNDVVGKLVKFTPEFNFINMFTLAKLLRTLIPKTQKDSQAISVIFTFGICEKKSCS